MNKLKMFKFYMLTTCVSYTFVILLQTLLFHFNHQNMSNELVVMIFIVCVIVNLLINVTHYLELQEWLTNLLSIIEIAFVVCTEYSCAATPQIRQTGNRLSGLAETVYASLLAQCFV